MNTHERAYNMKKKLRIISLFVIILLSISSNSLSDDLCADLIGNGRFKIGMSKTEIEKSFGETLREKKMFKRGSTYVPLIRLKNSPIFQYTTNVQPHFEGKISFELDANNKPKRAMPATQFIDDMNRPICYR